MKSSFHKIFIIVPLTIFVLFACGKQNDTLSKSTRPQWFLLERGRFSPIPDIEKLPDAMLLPWTSQERVTDIAYDSDTIIFGINGFGIAFLDANKLSTYTFHYFFDIALFNQKTITRIIPYGDEACCHFYFNSSLAGSIAGTNPKHFANFAFFPVEGTQDRFVPYLLPSQKKRAGYEAVGFLPETKIEWYIEWKKSGSITNFDYSSYDLAGKNESAISREEFRSAFTFTNIGDSSVEPAIGALARRIMEKTGLEKQDTTYHFFVKKKDTNLTERYIAKEGIDLADEAYDIENVQMFEDENGVYALSGNEGILYSAFDARAVLEMSLPELPEGYTYSGLFVQADTIFLTWEESSFYKTGNAGLASFHARWH